MSYLDSTKHRRDPSGSKSAVSARAAAASWAFATQSAPQTASPTATASPPHAPTPSRWPLRQERSADSGLGAVADAVVRDALVRGRSLEPGTIFRCSLADDGDTVHRIAAIGCSLYDIRSGLEVEREEIVVDTIHSASSANGAEKTVMTASDSKSRPVAAGVNTLRDFADEATIEQGRGA